MAAKCVSLTPNARELASLRERDEPDNIYRYAEEYYAKARDNSDYEYDNNYDNFNVRRDTSKPGPRTLDCGLWTGPRTEVVTTITSYFWVSWRVGDC